MNRREVITITVIINVILLSALFFMANRLEDDIMDSGLGGSKPISDIAAHVQEVSVPIPVRQIAAVQIQQDVPVDEVDTVLRDFAAAVAASQQNQVVKTEEPIPPSLPHPPQPLPQPSSSPVKPASTAPSNQNMVEVVVKRGDFLQKIANQNGSTIDAIKLVNNLKNDQLKVGQVLRVPVINKEKEPVAMNNKPVPAAAEGNTYKVKSGDSPWKIAKQFNVSPDELLRLNNLDGSSAKNLKPGDVIRVP